MVEPKQRAGDGLSDRWVDRIILSSECTRMYVTVPGTRSPVPYPSGVRATLRVGVMFAEVSSIEECSASRNDSVLRTCVVS